MFLINVVGIVQANAHGCVKAVAHRRADQAGRVAIADGPEVDDRIPQGFHQRAVGLHAAGGDDAVRSELKPLAIFVLADHTGIGDLQAFGVEPGTGRRVLRH